MSNCQKTNIERMKINLDDMDSWKIVLYIYLKKNLTLHIFYVGVRNANKKTYIERNAKIIMLPQGHTSHSSWVRFHFTNGCIFTIFI